MQYQFAGTDPQGRLIYNPVAQVAAAPVQHQEQVVHTGYAVP